ncbi:MAG: hypothetical protein HFJ09_05610 [Lachnospiraceae bacterium]|nr:hypothetical protein [Lachnospiraceae bacterium]
MKRKRKVQIGGILGICIVFLGVYFWGRNTMASKQTYLTEHETNVNLQEEVASENLLEETEQEGGKAEYVYDKLNRLKKVLYADGSYILYTYDKNGNIKTSKVTAAATPTPMPMITATPHKENIVEVYYQNTNWENAYIHYKVGNGEWTSVPGVKMSNSNEQSGYRWKYTIDLGTATEATVCFNNGSGLWDSKNQENYRVIAGIYGIKNQTVNKLQQIIPTATPNSNNKVEVYYYNTSWTNAYIHYQIGNGEWTQSPGKKMNSTNEQSGYIWKYTINLGTATEATVCFNNGSGTWDSKNQANYKVYTGSYGIKNQTVYKLQNVEGTPLPSQNTAEVYYYNTNWTNAYIHYQIGNGEWTAVPGKKMASTTEQSGYTWKYVIELGTETELMVCFNNGEGLWDSRNQQNYVLSGAKSYGVKNGNIYTLK